MGERRMRLISAAFELSPYTEGYIDGMEIALSAKEFDILEYLASRSPDIVSSEDIAEHVYDEF